MPSLLKKRKEKKERKVERNVHIGGRYQSYAARQVLQHAVDAQ
jgi:hypothetical protein